MSCDFCHGISHGRAVGFSVIYPLRSLEVNGGVCYSLFSRLAKESADGIVRRVLAFVGERFNRHCFTTSFKSSPIAALSLGLNVVARAGRLK
jgi:hypothetical protein